MRKFITILATVFVLKNAAQQTAMYTQYTFNKAGMNPAASGTDIQQDYNYVFGLNRQWLTFENAPKTNFLNFSYTIRPQRGYKFWQNAGIYIDQDDAGLLSSTGIYGSYTMHFLMRKKTVVSFGVYAGARKFERSSFNFDAMDPAIRNTQAAVWLYPDIIPGLRISNKKFWTGVALRQISITRLKDFKGRKIGGPSLLYPNIYMDYGRTIEIGEQALMMPSVAVNLPILAPPTVDASLMFYFANRVGVGASLRNASFASGILQIRLLKSLTAGFAYSYPVNNTRFVTQNSYEIMVGIIPLGMNTKLVGVNAIVRCPTLSY